MTVYSLEMLAEIRSESKNNGFSEPLSIAYQTDLTELVPRTILYMNRQNPSYCPEPLKKTIEDFAEKLVEDLGEDRYSVRSYLVYSVYLLHSHLLELGLLLEAENDHSVRKDKDFHKVATRLHKFFGRLQPMNIWYPHTGEVPDEIQAKREEKALEKAFCKK